ncbi:succinyl-diaminopimelate desuccinylase [Campylobacter sp. 2018MI01]|uniref:succinyl-diaminopimelate desuccinylase n=1 Tax=Campylobacter sp. 2018MI01 TaxID=2836735 RepID=UPI001BDB2092|nr:succinyl-diaminopimelate desuccinylase [Campylobacter sp. 2018MI01]MBT0878652.1 succinyl-diaminopimelate desuccinylase [Campylobacter sp. 2018MI01]
MLKKLFIDLLKEASVTPDAKNCYKITSEFLSNFDNEILAINNTTNQILSKEFNKVGLHICFCGHIDVVPSGNGWESEPFLPTIKDDLIIARGTQDMKSGVAAFLYAIKEFSKNNIKNIRKISIVLTSDEEGDGKDGVIKVLEELDKRNDLPNMCIVAEPTCEKNFGDSIKVGRRGSIHANIKILGTQGHAAYPSKCKNPVHLGASFLAKISGFDLDNGNEFFEPSKIVITNLSAGIGASNVTPSEFKIMLNVRNSPLTSKQDLEDFLRENLKNLDYELEIKQSSEPFYTDANSILVKTLKKALENQGIFNTCLNAKGGTSDARLFAKYGVLVCELGVVNDKIHAANESVPFSEVVALSNTFLEFLNLMEANNVN